MINQTMKRFKNSMININRNTIKWEDNMIQIPDISRIWVGNCFKDQLPVHLFIILFFIALSGFNQVVRIILLIILITCLLVWIAWYLKRKDIKDINIEINTGMIFSFASNNEDFTQQIYELIIDHLSKKDVYSDINIDFSGDGKIGDITLAVEEKYSNKEIVNVQSVKETSPVIIDLQKLLAKYTEKSNDEKDALELIENTIMLTQISDNEGIKQSFTEFIKKGLINDCNELGLYSLIEAIRNVVYNA